MPSLTIIFMGPQGSGKGTQLELLRKFIEAQDPERPVVQFEMGAALRAFGGKEGYSQNTVRESLARGEIQPDFLCTTLLTNALIENIRGDEHLLMDGFPRTLTQAKLLGPLFAFYKRENPTILSVTLDEGPAVERLIKRGRHDDTEEGIRKRFSWYREFVVPTLEYFQSDPLYRVVEVNGDQEAEKVHKDIIRELFPRA